MTDDYRPVLIRDGQGEPRVFEVIVNGWLGVLCIAAIGGRGFALHCVSHTTNDEQTIAKQ